MAAAMPESIFAAGNLGREVALENLHFDAFAGQLKQTFQAGRVKLELIEARTVPTGKAGKSVEQFSLLFRGARSSLLKQNTYQFENSALGRFDMFISPGRDDSRYCFYTAIFNRRPLGSEPIPTRIARPDKRTVSRPN